MAWASVPVTRPRTSENPPVDNSRVAAHRVDEQEAELPARRARPFRPRVVRFVDTPREKIALEPQRTAGFTIEYVATRKTYSRASRRL